MKATILSLTLLWLCTNAMAQAGSILTIGVGQVEADADIPPTSVAVLENKISRIIERSGNSTTGYANGIVLRPVVALKYVWEENDGMARLTVAAAELTLMAVSAGDAKLVFNSMSKMITGVGNSPAQAAANAISNMDVSDAAYTSFLAASQQKVLAYYNSHCEQTMRLSADAAARRDYEAAVSLLWGVPAEAACYAEAAGKARAMYAKYEKQLCGRVISYARGQVAIANYEQAVDALAAVDSKSSCVNEAQQLTREIEAKTERNINRQYTLEAQRARAMETIATAYYMRKARGKR